MSKTPPNRRGITFEVGAQLEARDSLKNWYAGNIEKIDYEDEKVLIHYRQWSHRHDKWFDWTSPYLRPVEKIQLRRRHLPGFHVNDKVLASWSDCRSYPAKVLAVNKDGSYTVKFYDGVIRTVKGIHVKPFIKERRRQKSQSSDKNIEEHCERNKKPQDLGGCSSKRVPCNSSEQEAESETEEDGVTSEWEEGDCDEQSHEKMDAQSDGSREDGYKARLKEKRLIRKRRHEEHKLQMKEEREGIEEGERVMEPVGQHNYSKSFVKRERKVIKEEEEDGQNMIIEDELTMDLGDVTKTKKIKGEMEPKTQVESIKKEMQLFSQGTPRHKTTQAQGMADKCIPDDSKPPSESPSEMANSCKGPLKALEQSEASRLSGEVKPAPPIKPVRKQGFHNPNRFSREPLYRVIKNQPPPVLSINLDHNPFKCSVQGCPKSFRKAKLLHYHMKYYHGDDRPLEEDLSPTSSIQTRSTEKQATTIFQNNPKRRRTVSASLHSGLQCPTHTLTSPRADRKSSSQLPERRRVSAPPAVDPHTHQQRPLLREKSKENQLDRGGPRTADKETERTSMEIACIKERGRLKEKKSNDLLCIKLKKRKKKKKAKSEYTGSENIDISLSSLQSKLSLPPKPPLSHKHAPEAPLCKPGQRQAGQIYVDDEESWTDWSTESCGWSEDEGGAETDTTPPLSCSSVAMGMQGQEIVRCVCEVEEEDDFMIQCEDCLCWQHGTCMGLLEEHVPDRYACYICRDPPGQRQSLRYWYDRDWLSNGYMYGLSFLEENYSQQNAKKIRTTHQLLGDVQHVEEVLNGLQLKMSVLQSQAHPDLRLWCQPWKLVDAALKLSRPGPGPVPSPVNAQEGLTRASSPSSTVQESYISSEHCYQKPQACYATLERHGGSEPEDGSRSAHYQQHYGQELHPTPAKSSSSSQLLDHSRVVDTAGWRQMDGAVESKGGVQPQQWQVNLLDHIEAVQDEVTHRMDFIERELDVLESWLDYTGELEPPEPLARLPQLKHRIKQLLTELGKVQQIALSCAT